MSSSERAAAASDGDDQVEDDLYGAENDTPPRTGADAVRAPDWSVQVVRTEKSVFELHRQWIAGRLVLDPEFQRAFVWSSDKQARLIESVLARIPLPAIYVSEESEDRVLMIDGQQRLTTLFRFLDGKLKLRSLTLLPQFEGKRFGDLEPRMQRRVEDTPLTVASVQAGSDPQVKFYLFERLNQGGVTLNAQEIRNGIFRGPGLDLVQRLAAEGSLFRQVAGTSRNYPRMKADELVLRGLAFLMLGVEPYPGDMQPYLNDALERLNKMAAAERDLWERRLGAALQAVQAALGDTAFRRLDPGSGRLGKHLNAALMDIQLVGFHRWRLAQAGGDDPEALVALAAAHGAAIRAATRKLYEDTTFVEATTYATSITSRVRYRLRAWQEAIDHVV